MSAPCRLAALAIAIATSAPATALAQDSYMAASSSAPTLVQLCGEGDAPLKADACKEAGYDRLAEQIDRAFAAALVRTPANIKPLLKRDKLWFNEIILSAAESVPQSDDADEKRSFGETLLQRTATLEAIAAGFGRPGFSGKWANAFGSVVLTPAEGGTYRLAIETRAVYGTGSERRRECKVTAQVKPDPGGWLTGTIPPSESKPTETPGDGNAADTNSKPAKPSAIKVRRQGKTLRVVVDDQEWQHAERPDCEYMWQLTGSYFASGAADGAADKADAAFVVPTFDCTRPETASDEEICADPDLAENDHRLNQAWKALLPRLDEATRRALTEDQRGYVHAQAKQYPEFLHPFWNKQSYFMHSATDARHMLDRLQRERIALLEGFDEKRSGLAGVWLSHTAILKVTIAEDGSLKGIGWKWEQGDWKAGCDFDIQGKVVKGAFRSEEERKNPDTLERDHASLIVNRQDDVFAKNRRRLNDDEYNTDEPKCRRSVTNSSTARLFPARPSPDIYDFGFGEGSLR